jgi:hypothetical protein
MATSEIDIKGVRASLQELRQQAEQLRGHL